jgi:hypothetical protein
LAAEHAADQVQPVCDSAASGRERMVFRVGETVVLVKDVEGVQAGKEPVVMSVRESEKTILLRYRKQEHLELVLV